MNSSQNPDYPASGIPATNHQWRPFLRWLPALLLCMLPALAQASAFKGEALDTAANVLAWIVLIVAPVIGITVFLLIHILPEKIAEKKHHPQAKAIQTLCLLSLFFGGMLWPLAWLWAYSKPVMYKLAYGTDKVAHDADEASHSQVPTEPVAADDVRELRILRQRIDELEARLSTSPSAGQTSGG